MFRQAWFTRFPQWQKTFKFEPKLPLVSPYGDLADIKLDYSLIIKVKNLTKFADPQAFSKE
jgi:hypothetical protein